MDQSTIINVEGDDMANKRKRSKKWIYWVVVLVLVVVAGVVAYLVWNNYFANKSDNTTEPETTSKEEVPEKTPDTKKPDTDNTDTEDYAEPEQEKEKVLTYEGGDPNKAEELTGALTFASVEGDYLLLRVNIDQYLNSGTCQLSLSQNGGIVYSESANITSAASTATCEGFNVPLSALGTGDFEVVVHLDSAGKSGFIRGGVTI